MTQSYPIASNRVELETEVNRSRFICYLFPCQSSDAMRTELKRLQQLHPQACHYCHAFIVGAPNDSQRYGFSDDGEPSGTAGRPMLAVLQGSGVGELAAIVVRYFGGTKLGTGGLQRAYGASVRNALELLDTDIRLATVTKVLSCEYHFINDVQHLMAQFGIEVLSQDFQEKIILVLAIPCDQLKLFEQQLLTISAGSLKLTAE